MTTSTFHERKLIFTNFKKFNSFELHLDEIFSPLYFLIAIKIIVDSKFNWKKGISQSLFDIFFFLFFSAQIHFHNRNNSMRPLWAKNISQLATSSLMRNEKVENFPMLRARESERRGSDWMLGWKSPCAGKIWNCCFLSSPAHDCWCLSTTKHCSRYMQITFWLKNYAHSMEFSRRLWQNLEAFKPFSYAFFMFHFDREE